MFDRFKQAKSVPMERSKLIGLPNPSVVDDIAVRQKYQRQKKTTSRKMIKEKATKHKPYGPIEKRLQNRKMATNKSKEIKPSGQDKPYGPIEKRLQNRKMATKTTKVDKSKEIKPPRKMPLLGQDKSSRSPFPVFVGTKLLKRPKKHRNVPK